MPQPEPPSYQGRTFPTRGALITHLVIELKTPKGLVSNALYKHNWNIKAAVEDLKSRPPPAVISYIYQGRSYPTKTAVVRHLESQGIEKAHAVTALTGQLPGDVTEVVERYCEAFDLLLQPPPAAAPPRQTRAPAMPTHTSQFLIVGPGNPDAASEAQTVEEYMRVLLAEARWIESACPYRLYRREDGRLIWRAHDIE